MSRRLDLVAHERGPFGASATLPTHQYHYRSVTNARPSLWAGPQNVRVAPGAWSVRCGSMQAWSPQVVRTLSSARAALASGRLTLARDILGTMSTGIRDAEAFKMLGEIRHRIGDLPGAGAAWFATSAKGTDRRQGGQRLAHQARRRLRGHVGHHPCLRPTRELTPKLCRPQGASRGGSAIAGAIPIPIPIARPIACSGVDGAREGPEEGRPRRDGIPVAVPQARPPIPCALHARTRQLPTAASPRPRADSTRPRSSPGCSRPSSSCVPLSV